MELVTGDPANLFRVKIVADSIVGGTGGQRLVTFQLTYPRVVLAELNTHRMFSRSTESSRAIPGKKRLEQLRKCAYVPLRFGKRVAGMGSGTDLEREESLRASAAWRDVLSRAVAATESMLDAGLAKEELNRVTEPFSLVRTVLTATDWGNFFAQRCDDNAYPPFRFMARAMFLAMGKSKPQVMCYGQWHMPYIGQDDYEAARLYVADWLKSHPEIESQVSPFPSSRYGAWLHYHLCRWSAARCARVSYGLMDGKRANPEADDVTWAKLSGHHECGKDNPLEIAWIPAAKVGHGERWPYTPIHGSAMEHQATPEDAASVGRYMSNLRGWLQFRKFLGGENVAKFEVPPEVVESWQGSIPAEVFSDSPLY